MRLTRNSEAARGVVAFLLVISLFANALIPTGWMPAVSDHGQIAIQICSGSQPGAWLPSNAHHTGKSSKDSRQPAKPCPFTAGRVLFDDDLRVPVIAFVGTPSARVTLSSAYSTTTGVLSSPPLGSRAPPYAMSAQA